MLQVERTTMGMADVGRGEPLALLSGAHLRQRFAPHMHETYAIGVMERGASRSRYRGVTVLHAAGQIVVIEPGEVHTGEAIDVEGWAYRMLYPSVALMSWVADAAGLPRVPSFAQSAYTDPALARRMAGLHDTLAARAELAPSHDPLAAEEALVNVLGTLMRGHGDGSHLADAAGAARPTAALRRVRAYLDEHYTEVVRLRVLAELAALSPFHLIRQFRRAYGVPPYAYVQLVRVERVKAMLRQGRLISYAAHASGMSDQSHLTRVFRRVVGVPPGEYARAFRARPACAAR